NQPRSTAEALQAAQVSMSSESKMAHPFYWGAFVVVGDGSRTIQSVKQ
ncbi:MAG: hypothetical protein RLY67_571, partial [Pseudomonadota bacterium]